MAPSSPIGLFIKSFPFLYEKSTAILPITQSGRIIVQIRRLMVVSQFPAQSDL
jgi:hypothetical protein